MRWGEVETYKFVKIYLSHEYLWNSEHENYKLKDKRQKAYQAIIKDFSSSTGMKLNENEVRIKIKNLRSTYIQEVAKIRTRSRPNSTYIPTIKWFLDWHNCFKHRSKNIPTGDLIYEEDYHKDNSWITDTAESKSYQQNMFIAHPDNYEFIVKCEPDVQHAINPITLNTYKLKQENIKLNIPLMDSKICGSVSSSLEPFSHEDEFDIYGKYIASQLRRMDLEKALRLQLEIASLVSEARIADLSAQ